MEDRAIIPNRNIILVPFEAHLEIVVARNKLQEIGLEDLALSLRNVIDVPGSNLPTGGKKTLPACHRVGANYRVHSLKIEPGVLWGAAVFVDKLKAVLFADVYKVGLVVGCSERLGKFLNSWGEAIVCFISRRPQGVTTSCIFRKGVDLKYGVV